MAWGSVLSGIGSIIGAGASLFGGKKEDNYHPEVWRNQATHDRMRQARDLDIISKEYGIHPLVLYGGGMPSSGGFANPVVSGSGSHIGDVMGNVGRAFADIGSLYESDQDRLERERDRLDRKDEFARDRMERRIERATEEKFRNEQRSITDAEVRRLDSETMLNAARTRTELQQLRNGTLGAVSNAQSLPSSVTLPYTGNWALKPGTSSASDVQNLLGEPFEWLSSVENAIWNLLHDPDGSIKVGPRPGQVPKSITMGIPAY